MKVLRDSMYTYTTVLYDDSVVYASCHKPSAALAPTVPRILRCGSAATAAIASRDAIVSPRKYTPSFWKGWKHHNIMKSQRMNSNQG